MIKTVTDVWRKRAVLRHFIAFQLTTNYRTKSFGFVWALLDPLLFMGVYFIVFGKVLGHRPLYFMLHIYIGVTAFRFLSTSLAGSAQVLKGQAGIIREIAFPKAVLPASIVATRLFDFVGAWLGAIVIGCIFGIVPTVHWLWIPFFVAFQALFVLGLSLTVAYVGVFFADIANFIDVGMRLWFYLSPVLYMLSEARDKIAGNRLAECWYAINPMTAVMQTYEYAVFKGHPWVEGYMTVLPAKGFALQSLLTGLGALLLGLLVFSRAEKQVSKYV